MKNYHRFTPGNLEFKAKTVGAGASAASVVVPWRGFINFQTVVIHGWLDSGTPNWSLQIYLFDWNKVQIQGPISVTNGIVTMDCVKWVKDNASRQTNGTSAGEPVWMNASPYMKFGILNSDVASVVANLEVMAYDGTGF